jgi:hypothetical protein
MEPHVKYHSSIVRYLTPCRYPVGGQCLRVSLTGAVSSQKVTEDYEGSLSPVGNRALEHIGIRELDCETYKSSRDESRSK